MLGDSIGSGNTAAVGVAVGVALAKLASITSCVDVSEPVGKLVEEPVDESLAESVVGLLVCDAYGVSLVLGVSVITANPVIGVLVCDADGDSDGVQLELGVSIKVSVAVVDGVRVSEVDAAHVEIEKIVPAAPAVAIVPAPTKFVALVALAYLLLM